MPLRDSGRCEASERMMATLSGRKHTAVAGGVGAFMTAVAADNMTECAGAWGALLFGIIHEFMEGGPQHTFLEFFYQKTSGT